MLSFFLILTSGPISLYHRIKQEFRINNMSVLVPMLTGEEGENTVYYLGSFRNNKLEGHVVVGPPGKLVRRIGHLYLYESRSGKLQWWRLPQPAIPRDGGVHLVPDLTLTPPVAEVGKVADRHDRVWTICFDARVYCGNERIRETIPPVKKLHCMGAGEHVVAETFNWRFYVFSCIGTGRPKFMHVLKPWRRMKHERIKCFAISPDTEALAYSYGTNIEVVSKGGKEVRVLTSPCRVIISVEKLLFSTSNGWLLALCVGLENNYFVVCWCLGSESNDPMRIVHPTSPAQEVRGRGRGKEMFFLNTLPGHLCFGIRGHMRSTVDVEAVPFL